MPVDHIKKVMGFDFLIREYRRKENMKDKKYLPSVLIMYLNYFIHGVGCSVLGQFVIKESLATNLGM